MAETQEPQRGKPNCFLERKCKKGHKSGQNSGWGKVKPKADTIIGG